VTIGGVNAPVAFAGIVGAWMRQLAEENPHEPDIDL
jgi:hypothetical protein